MWTWWLEKSEAGYKYILEMLHSGTQRPKTITLHSIIVAVVTGKFLKVFLQVGILKDMLMAQGPTFTSQLMKEVWDLLRVKSLKTVVYHPQTDRLVEYFNKMLTNMKKFVTTDPRYQDCLLPPLLFIICEVPQASTASLH